MTPDLRSILARIPGLIAHGDGAALAELAASVPADRAIVEIGAHRGLSSCWLAAGAREGQGARVYSIDPWPDGDREDPAPGAAWAEKGALTRWRANIASIGAGDIATPLRMSGAEAAALWVTARGGPRPVGFWFHDADHSYAAVRDDYRAWLPYLAPGCWVAVHDYFGAVPDGAGGWRRDGSIQPAVARTILSDGAGWTDVRVIGSPDGDARTTPNLWVGRRG